MASNGGRRRAAAARGNVPPTRIRSVVTARRHGGSLRFAHAGGVGGYTSGETMSSHRDRICALTSLSPAPHQVAAQRAALQSWMDADLEIHSFQHPSEVDTIKSLYAVDVVPVPRTTA